MTPTSDEVARPNRHERFTPVVVSSSLGFVTVAPHADGTVNVDSSVPVVSARSPRRGSGVAHGLVVGIPALAEPQGDVHEGDEGGDLDERPDGARQCFA